MNKTELVAKIAEKAEIKKVDAEKALKAFEEAVTAELVACRASLAVSVLRIMRYCPKCVPNNRSAADFNESAAHSDGRGDRTRTCGLVVPNHARYQLRNTSFL